MSDAILLRVELKPGLLQRFVRRLPGVRNSLDKSRLLTTGLQRLFQTVLRIEGLYTESLFLARRDDGDVVFWYMEAEDISQFYETFEAALDADSALAIVAAKIIRCSIKNPEKALTYSEDSKRFELFLHGTNPERP